MRLPIALLPLTIMISHCGDDPRMRREQDTSAIRALIETTEEMNNTGNADGWAELFAEGAVYMPPGQPEVDTREGLLEAGRAGFTAYSSDITITPAEIVVAGDWAFARSRVTGSVSPRSGGDSIPIDVKQIIIYQRQADGSWKIARLIGNSNG